MRRGLGIFACLLAGCGASAHQAVVRSSASLPTRSAAGAAGGRLRRPAPVSNRSDPRVLVTAETENRLLVLDLRSGRVLRRVALARDPENVVSSGATTVVVSSRARTVTLLDSASLRVRARIVGFSSPHIPAVSADHRYAFVTDDAGGTLTVIRLSDGRVLDKLAIGAGAHHLSASPDGKQLWIALGETARTIMIIDTGLETRPRVVARFDPGFAAHDLSFSPDGRRIWVTSASGQDVAVFRARDHRLLFAVAAGAPPQHVAFAGRYAFLTSGYGSGIEKLDAATGQVLARARTPYGSFELGAGHGVVATSSLFTGTLTIFDQRLRRLHAIQLAPATRDLAISGG